MSIKGKISSLAIAPENGFAKAGLSRYTLPKTVVDNRKKSSQ
jgi:hypothetical protein